MATPFHDLGLRPRPGTRLSTNIAPEGITVHYGGDSPWGKADRSSPERFAATTNHDRCETIVRAWDADHRSPNGRLRAVMLGYNSAVCPHAHRFNGRGRGHRSGANGTDTGNYRSYAVVYVAGGNDPVTPGAMRAFHDEAARLGVPLRWCHSDWKATACPGPHLRAWQRAGFPLPASDPLGWLTAMFTDRDEFRRFLMDAVRDAEITHRQTPNDRGHYPNLNVMVGDIRSGQMVTYPVLVAHLERLLRLAGEAPQATAEQIMGYLEPLIRRVLPEAVEALDLTGVVGDDLADKVTDRLGDLPEKVVALMGAALSSGGSDG